jgi:signal transduction histidine kinase/limonene-1,2-epoxide hydrolase
MSTLRSIVDRTYEVFNSRSFDQYRELLAEDVELVMSGIHVKGLAAVTDFVSVTAQVRPAMRIEPQLVFIETGDTIVTQVRMIDAPPEGSPDDALVETDACGLYRIEDGRIVIWRVYVDPVGEDLSSVALAAAAAEQAALRRVAELVARQTPPEELFEVVGEELGRLLEGSPVRAVRFEPDEAAVDVPDEGEAWVETPIVVDGRPWGAIRVGGSSAAEPPGGTEERVAQFAELLSTSISNFESRARVTRLAAEQSGLRRIATLVAGHPPPEVVFATLAEELGALLEVDTAAILRYETDATATVLAGWSTGAMDLHVGERLSLEGENLATDVFESGAARRKEDYSQATGEIADIVREQRIRSAVGSPIVVEEKIWGVISVMSLSDLMPPDTEDRISAFSRHAATAVANANSRSDLARSRARLVQAGDEARRRFERDLHDGAQQRLVSLGLELRAVDAGVPVELGDLRRDLARIAGGLREVVDGLRELSRGLHPAVLSEGGLDPALRALARRSAVPVDLQVHLDDQRFDEPVEVTAYYVASEALTNTAKHAAATRVDVLVEHREGLLELRVSDDGRGGADAAGGTGLTGLVDRVEAIGGTIRIVSPAGKGTALEVRLPSAPPRLPA